MKLFFIVILAVLATFAWAQDEVQYDDDDASKSISDYAESVRVARSPYRQSNHRNNHRGHGNYGPGNHGLVRPYNQHGYPNNGHGRNPYRYTGK